MEGEPYLTDCTKIGFHTGMDGNTEGLFEYMQQLDSSGVPFFLKTVDNAEFVYYAQEMAKVSGIPHTLVFRAHSGTGNYDYDVPNYNLSPKEAARIHWEEHKAVFPPELDPSYVWIETINEVDKDRSEWLAEFAIETAYLTMADGFKWAAFGWSSGEPEREHWEGPKMIEFLRLASSHPNSLAIALHEYSYSTDNIRNQFPHLIGRFQMLFDVCDQNNIPRPTVLITEWGWGAFEIPDVDRAMEDIIWASELYSSYPQILGAATWYLGGGFNNIADQVQQLIDPLADFAVISCIMPSFPPGDRCEEGPSPYCSPSDLESFCLDSTGTTYASWVCELESGGSPASINNNCTIGRTYDFSIGLFQINLLAGHCPLATLDQMFSQYDRDSSSCTIRPGNQDCSIYNVFANVDMDSCTQELVNCIEHFLNPNNNRYKMSDLSNNCTSWSPWSYAKNQCGLP